MNIETKQTHIPRNECIKFNCQCQRESTNCLDVLRFTQIRSHTADVKGHLGSCDLKEGMLSKVQSTKTVT